MLNEQDKFLATRSDVGRERSDGGRAKRRNYIGGPGGLRLLMGETELSLTDPPIVL